MGFNLEGFGNGLDKAIRDLDALRPTYDNLKETATKQARDDQRNAAWLQSQLDAIEARYMTATRAGADAVIAVIRRAEQDIAKREQAAQAASAAKFNLTSVSTRITETGAEIDGTDFNILSGASPLASAIRLYDKAVASGDLNSQRALWTSTQKAVRDAQSHPTGTDRIRATQLAQRMQADKDATDNPPEFQTERAALEPLRQRAASALNANQPRGLQDMAAGKGGLWSGELYGLSPVSAGAGPFSAQSGGVMWSPGDQDIAQSMTVGDAQPVGA